MIRTGALVGFSTLAGIFASFACVATDPLISTAFAALAIVASAGALYRKEA